MLFADVSVWNAGVKARGVGANGAHRQRGRSIRYSNNHWRALARLLMMIGESVSFMLGKHSVRSTRCAVAGSAPQRRWAAWAVVAAMAASVAGCGSMGSLTKSHETHRDSVIAGETFGASSTYSRLFDATPERTCEAARRALMSQGYLINGSKVKEVEGQKSFQPATDNHQIITIRVVCAADSRDGKVSLGFVSALKDTYNLKKASNSASVGVGALGSLSLPFSAGNDSMIKVGSETVNSATFYDSFFDLIKSFLRQEDKLRQQSLQDDEEFVE